MKYIRQHALFVFVIAVLLTLVIFTLVGCTEMQMQDVITDLMDPPVGMVLIPAGDVQLGVDIATLDNPTYAIKVGAIAPQHTVFVDAFYIDTHEVTIGEWKAFVEATGYAHWIHPAWAAKYWSRDDLPVSIITFKDAKAYAAWAGKRLPTPDEWEKAARGGLVGMQYPWGNVAPTDAHGHFSKGSEALPMPVGSYPPNGYGLYDMAGNVAEMTTEYLTNCRLNARGKTVCDGKLRGGSYMLGGPTVWRTDTFSTVPDTRPYYVGFRCVADAK